MTRRTAVLPAHLRQVLHLYGAGRSVTDIRAMTGLSADMVTAVLAGRAGWDRGRARHLVREHDHHHRQRIAQEPPMPQSSTPPAPPEHPAGPVIRSAKSPAEQPRDHGVPEPLARLLDAGEASPVAATRTRTRKIRDMLDDLRGRLDGEKEIIATRERVERLRAQLDTETAKLRLLQGRPAAEPDPGRTPARTIRAWAREQNLTCPGTGRVPQHVLDAYLAAHPGETA